MAVSDLAAVAQGAWREAGKRDVLAVIDARMAEVYAAAYRVDERGLTRLCGAETVVAADQWAPPPGAWHGAGSGWDGYAETLRARPGIRLDSVEPGRLPQARDIATLAVSGDRLDPADALPIYLRDQVARPATG